MNTGDMQQFQRGERTLEFERTNGDMSPGSETGRDRLAATLQESKVAAEEQDEGLRNERAATARKRNIRDSLTSGYLFHIARAGQAAAQELPDLAKVFAFKRKQAPFAMFRTRAHTMLSAAEEHKDLLVKYGMSADAVTGLAAALEDFDKATTDGIEARRRHINASTRLQGLARKVAEMVKVMDGLNRHRFRDNAPVLAEWKSVSRILDVAPRKRGDEGTPDDGTPPPAGQIGTAA